MASSFTVIPAIDLRQGKVVRLFKGDYERQTDYEVAPAALAASYADTGAEWLHVVDLDGAREGNLANLKTLRELVAAGMKVQAGGGVRSGADVERLFEAGVQRVVLGSLSVREPDTVCEWLATFGPERLTIALDTHFRDGAWRLPSAGWLEAEKATLDELAPFYADAGAKHVLSTDIDRDGTLSGPNLSLYRHLNQRVPKLVLQASGGVRELDDIRAAREAGASGIVLGRALLEGRFTLAEALTC